MAKIIQIAPLGTFGLWVLTDDGRIFQRWVTRDPRVAPGAGDNNAMGVWEEVEIPASLRQDVAASLPAVDWNVPERLDLLDPERGDAALPAGGGKAP